MKITKSQLRQIIKEEVAKTLREREDYSWDPEDGRDPRKGAAYSGPSAEESMDAIQKLVSSGRVSKADADKTIADAKGDPEKLNHARRNLLKQAAAAEKAMDSHMGHRR